MLERIVKGLREFVLGLSIILMIIGLFLFLMGFIFYFIPSFEIDMFKNFDQWNAYILVIGLIVLFFGVYYLYSFLKKRKFVLDELKTNKRSELQKKHTEIVVAVKHLPSKYKRLLEEKEDELGIDY